MFKVMMLVRRKPGLTHEEFRRHYESTHVPLALGTIPQIRGYVRNYIRPEQDFVQPDDDQQNSGYDCITEFWYEDKAAWEEVKKRYREGDLAAIMEADEVQFMDRDQMKVLIAEECVSRVEPLS